MNVRDLTSTEREVLFALLGHLTHADQRDDPDEARELVALGEEMGIDDLPGEVSRAGAVVRTRTELLNLAETVEREDARELIRTLLFDLANADGERSAPEADLLDGITLRWSRD